MSDISEEVARVLGEFGVGPVDDGLHDWRCGYPDSYGGGPCTHLADLVAALVAVKAVTP